MKDNSAIFPLWMSFLSPSLLWLILLVCFVWSSLILFLVLKILRVRGVRKTWKKTVLKLWIAALATEFIAAVILWLSRLNLGDWWSEYISGPITRNPYDNWYSLFYVVLALLVAGVFSYLLVRRFVFHRLDLERKKKRVVALILAVCLVPYPFLIPAGLLERPYQEIYFFTNHIVPEEFDTVTIIQYSDQKESASAFLYSNVQMLMDAVNHASACKALPQDLEKESYLLRFSSEEDDKKSVEVHLYLNAVSENGLYFSVDGQNFQVLEQDETKIRELIKNLSENGFTYRYTIVDQTVVANHSPEWLAEDETYSYYLTSTRSQYIILCFENGDVLSLTEALEKRVVDIYDLIRNGLDVIAVPISEAPLLTEKDEG